MRTWKLISGVGVAIVAAWLAVTNLAHAAEFACVVPWTSDTDCGWSKFTIRPQELIKIEVYSVQKKSDGSNVGKPALFTIKDTNNGDAVITDMAINAGNTGSWKNTSKETAFVVQMRLNVKQGDDVVVRGRYDVTK
jgi:hypothetical protein